MKNENILTIKECTLCCRKYIIELSHLICSKPNHSRADHNHNHKHRYHYRGDQLYLRLMAAIIAQLTRTARKRRSRKSYGANKCLYSLQPFAPNGFDPAVHNKYCGGDIVKYF